MSGHYARNPHYNKSDISIDDLEAEEEAERHDAFLRKLVDDEYWLKIRGAQASHDLICGVAADKFGQHSPGHCAEIDRADETFRAVVQQAQADKITRLAKLRANDAVVAERETPRIYLAPEVTA